MRQIKPSAKFRQEKTNGAAIEITEGVDGQETPFGKGQELQRQLSQLRRRRLPACLEITPIVPHQHGQGVGKRGLQTAYLDLDVPPFPGPVRHEISTKAAVKL